MAEFIERRSFLAGTAATVAAAGVIPAVGVAPAAAQNEKVLRIAMAASDVPLTAGGPDNGFEGFRFTGYTVYDALINWDLRPSDKPAPLAPGLATSWVVDPGDRTRWTIKLRPDVKFHDGSAFDADAVIWNVVKLFDDKAPHHGQRAAAQVKSRIGSLASWSRVDASTVELRTRVEDAFFPYQQTAFDPVEQDGRLADLHARAVDDALFVWIAHDVNPRGLAKRVKPFAVANSWYVDLTAVDVT